MKPWTDRAGRISPIKSVAFIGAFVPGILILLALVTGNAGPRPFEFATHETGEWAVRFLLIGLAVTPFRRIFDWPRLILVRRMIGITALSYAVIHFGAYVFDLNFNLLRVASEITLRIYLLIGFVALMGLVALGVTSTDAAIRQLGRNWTRLHKIVYLIAGLGLLHYFMQSKLDVSLPTMYAGLFLLLMSYRAITRAGLKLSPVTLVGAAIFATIATMGLEVAWFGLATGIPVDRIFFANFDFVYMIRPAWWVGTAGVAVAVLSVLRGGISRVRRRASAVGAAAE